MSPWKLWLRRVHLWCAVAGGLVVIALGVSGTVLVFREEIERAFYDPTIAPTSSRSSIAAAAARATSLYTERRLALVVLPTRDDAPYEFVLQVRGARTLGEADQLSVYVDPGSGEVIGQRRRRDSIIWTLRDLHFALFSGVTGLMANGLFGALLAVMSVTGLVLWLARPSGRFTVKWRANWKRVTWDLHQVVGALSFLVLTLTGATGVYYAFRAPVTTAILAVTASPPLPRVPTVTRADGAVGLDLDTLIAAVAPAFPLRSIAVVRLPASPTQPYTFTAHAPGDIGESIESGLSAYVDPYTGRVLQLTHTSEDSLGQRVIGAIEPLHFGTVGGLTTRIVWALAGLAPAFLAVSGGLMWWNRRSR